MLWSDTHFRRLDTSVRIQRRVLVVDSRMQVPLCFEGDKKDCFAYANQFSYDCCCMNNQPFNNGILYDCKGVIEYDGLWRSSKIYSLSLDAPIRSNRSEFFFITSYGFNRVETFVLPQWFHKLTHRD